jgi:hypothetical protein
VVVLVGCGETYIDTSLLDQASTTTSLPTGDGTTVPAEPSSPETESTERSAVLDRIDDALDRLSDAVAEDPELASELLADIEAEWSTIEEGVRSQFPAQLFGIQQAIDLANSAVTRKRPADASKAWKILRDVVPTIG